MITIVLFLCTEVVNYHAGIRAGGGYLKVQPHRRGRPHQPLNLGTLFSSYLPREGNPTETHCAMIVAP